MHAAAGRSLKRIYADGNIRYSPLSSETPLPTHSPVGKKYFGQTLPHSCGRTKQNIFSPQSHMNTPVGATVGTTKSLGRSLPRNFAHDPKSNSLGSSQSLPTITGPRGQNSSLHDGQIDDLYCPKLQMRTFLQ